MQDFAALDALEANHYATKQTASSSTATADQHSAGPGHASVVAYASAATQAHPCRAQFSTADPVVAPSTECLHNRDMSRHDVLASQQAPSYHQAACHRQPPPPMLAQTSMQRYIAAHSARDHIQQPAATAAVDSALLHQLVQLPRQQSTHSLATGVLADDDTFCIDLTSQSGPTAPADTPSAAAAHSMAVAHAGQHTLPSGVVAAAPAAAEAPAGAEEGPAEEGTAGEVLMECSANLLNPGIRVHKYSLALLCILLPTALSSA